MSIRMMSAVWQMKVETHDKIVLMAIADHVNDDGCGLPSVGTIADKVSMSERGVRNVLHRLTAAGYLVLEKAAHRSVDRQYRLVV